MISYALYILLRIYSGVILFRILLSWVVPDQSHPLVRALATITDPVLDPCRRIFPPIGPGIDLSPIIAIVGIELLQKIVLMFPF